MRLSPLRGQNSLPEPRPVAVFLLIALIWVVTASPAATAAVIDGATAPAPPAELKANPHPTDEPESLPIYLTDEERGRLHEIGLGHLVTEPPPAPARNCAEWEPVQGVLIRYPLGLPWNLVRDYADHTICYVLVSSGSHSTAVSNFNSNGVNMSNVEWLIMGTNSIWTRDYGPWFVFDGNDDQGIIDHIYNRPRPLDDQVNWNLGPILGVPVYGDDLRHTGGNYMTDGHGIAFSTDLVWDENPGMTQQEIADVMQTYLGIHTYHVVPDISNYGIHHIDCWTKLLDEETLLVKQVAPGHADYPECEANAALLAGMTNCYGRPYEVVRVNCPSIGGSSVASYTNSLILNGRVYVPTFNITGDAAALAAYEAAMPGYEVLGFTGSWYSDDAIHCRGKGIMDIGMLYVDHNPLQEQEYGFGGHEVTASIKALGGTGLRADSLLVNWRLEGQSEWSSEVMTAIAGADSFAADIPEQLPQSVVEYYVSAVDNTTPTPRRTTRPWVAPAGYFSFEVTGSAAVGDDRSPVAARLLCLAPNPFRPRASVSFALDTSGPVSLSVYAPTGRLVDRLLDQTYLQAGAHSFSWDGTTIDGAAAPSGVYLFRLVAGERVELRRGVLLR